MYLAVFRCIKIFGVADSLSPSFSLPFSGCEAQTNLTNIVAGLEYYGTFASVNSDVRLNDIVVIITVSKPDDVGVHGCNLSLNEDFLQWTNELCKKTSVQSTRLHDSGLKIKTTLLIIKPNSKLLF